MMTPETKLHLALQYAQGVPVKVIAYDFGVGQSQVTRIASAMGVPYRHVKSAWNVLNERTEARAAELFRQGCDTMTIARMLCVKEPVVANALAHIRDRERSR